MYELMHFLIFQTYHKIKIKYLFCLTLVQKTKAGDPSINPDNNLW